MKRVILCIFLAAACIAGAATISDLRLGSQQPAALYLGSQLIWAAAQPGYAPFIATGTYTGDGTTDWSKSVALDFQPDFVLIWADGIFPQFKESTSWYGRGQFLSDEISRRSIGSLELGPEAPFRGNGFTVAYDGAYPVSNFNVSGKVFHYLAIKDNRSDFFQETSWFGNVTANRQIDWLSEQADMVLAKRDAARASVWKWSNSAESVLGKRLSGTGDYITSLDADGITIDDSVYTNELTLLLGEGIDGLAFTGHSDVFEVIEWTGDGSSNRLIPSAFQANCVIILDAANVTDALTTYHGIVSDTMPVGTVKAFDGSAHQSGWVNGLEAGGIRLVGTPYNQSGRNYVAFAFRNNSPSLAPEITKSLAGKSKGILFDPVTGYGELANFPALSGACSVEWYGRIRYDSDYIGGQEDQYLLMVGQGDSGTQVTSEGEYNFGLYLYQYDPENLGWLYPGLRFIQHDYFSSTRLEGDSIVLQNPNTGQVLAHGEDAHLMLVHYGSGHWRVFLNGKQIKDYAIDMSAYNGRSNGGTGIQKDGVLNAYKNDAGTITAPSRSPVYRVAAWTSALSDADVLGRYLDSIGNTAYSGAAPTKEYDFRTDGTAPDATLTGATVVDRSFVSDWEMETPVINHVQTADGSTLAYTPPDVSNAKLVVCVYSKDLANDNPVTGVSFGATPLTLGEHAETTDGSNNSNEAFIYELDSPGTSAETITVTGGQSVGIVAMTLSATAPIRSAHSWVYESIVSGTVDYSWTAPDNFTALYIGAGSSGSTSTLVYASDSRGLEKTQLAQFTCNSTTRVIAISQVVEPQKTGRVRVTSFQFRQVFAGAAFYVEQ